MAASVAEAVLAVVLFVVLPVRGQITNRRLDETLGVDPAEPARTFRRSALIKWGLSAVALVLLIGDLGVLLVGAWLAWLLPLAIGIVGGAFIYRLRVRPALGDDEPLGDLGRTAALLPITRQERRAWVGLSVTAGVTEEILYRAFLVVYLHALWPAAGLVGAACVAGIAFGLAHLYQGWRGVILTTAIGIVFGILYPWSGLLVLIAIHVMIDLRVLLVPPAIVERARAARSSPRR